MFMKKILKVVVGILGIIVVLGIVFFMVDYNRVEKSGKAYFLYTKYSWRNNGWRYNRIFWFRL